MTPSKQIEELIGQGGSVMESSTDTVQSATEEMLEPFFQLLRVIPVIEGNPEARFSVVKNRLDLGERGISYLEQVQSCEFQPGDGIKLASALNEVSEKYPSLIDALYELTRAREREKELVEALKACAEEIECVHKAFGPPGDYGYSSKEGKALYSLYKLSPAVARALAGGKP